MNPEDESTIVTGDWEIELDPDNGNLRISCRSLASRMVVVPHTANSVTVRMVEQRAFRDLGPAPRATKRRKLSEVLK